MKHFGYRVRLLLLVLVAFSSVACKKDVSFQTSIVLKSWSQESSGDELYRVDDMVMYGFAADTTLYTVAGYEDALAGVMTGKKDPAEKISAQLVGTPCLIDGYGEALMMPAPDYQSLVILAVNRQEQLYGYTQLALVENLPYLYISVQFQPWKESSSYKNGQWWMFNDNFVPDINCTIRPKIRLSEEGEAEYLTQSRLFAYRVESPEEWLPADWENAEVGRLVNTSTGEAADPVYSVSADSQGNLAAKLPPEDLLVMVVNADRKCYALRSISAEEILSEEEKAPEERGIELVFPFWNLNPPAVTDNGWTCYYTPSITATVTTTVQTRHNEAVKPLTESILYAYATSNGEGWLPASIEAASQGLLIDPDTGETIEADYEFPFEKQSSQQLTLPMGDYLLMVVSQEQCCYALRPFSTAESGMSFQLNFPITRTDFPFVDGEGWEIHYLPNHGGSINTYIEKEEPGTNPSDTPETGNETGDESENEGTGEESQPVRNPHFPPFVEETIPPVGGTKIFGSVLHAYQVEEPEKWMPGNLADARDGRLTHIETGERITPLYTFEANSAGTITPKLPYGKYLLLVANYDNGCYALRSISEKQKLINDSILFPVWRSDLPITDEKGWTICYTPNVQAEISVSYRLAEGDEPSPLDANLLYVCQVEDPEMWYPISLADALNGRLTHKERQETAPIVYSYEANRGEDRLSIDLLQGDYLVLVVNRIGCCALHTLTADQTQVSLTLDFPLWRTDSPFTDEAGWSIYNWYTPAEPEQPENPEEPENPENPEEPENPETPESFRR